ncbi:MAG: hypothetical protein WCY88_08135 [Spongiibacteraceae bacterium]
MTDLLAVDFHNMHLLELPGRLTGDAGLRAAIAARELPAICFQIENSDHAYTYCPGPETINIVAGTEAETILNLGLEQWRSMIVWLQTGEQQVVVLPESLTGNEDFIHWRAALKEMYLS